ncbi:phospholipase D alpha 4 [Salvia miltiorrhiza]|uniref:phospholipase D alpha 4 n=1 Tax=Salvia miltiorrhiza TaxID=226208 RepID=UPI0025ACFBA8|nr:phospholipase D alpha 4 [Salvia miltiorrhiza]
MEENGRFLHGTLEVTIFRATMYKSSVPFKCISLGRRSSYVTIKIDNKKMAKTSNESDHVWNQTFQILCAHPPQTIITLTLKRRRSVLGKIEIHAHKLLGESSLINGFFPLSRQSGKQKKKLKLQFIVWFKPAEDEKPWEKALENGGYQGLKNASFPLRSSCGVTLYQDAHHHPSFQPPSDARPRRLWEDVYNAIDGSKHLIYIAGWSFNPRMALVRDPETDVPHARGVKLGELLKRKADEGVAVRVLLWDDETSLPLIKNKGVMKTHDEDALAYFKHTRVVCKLCPRLHDKFPTAFAHHQKAITVDSLVDHSSRSREIMSFLGGLDLCDGRYDTEEHSLFKTLNTESHCYDFYQTSLQGASLHKGGPREPWHDVHACVVGQAGRDVLENFEQRWTKQCDPSLLVPVSSIQELSQSQQPNPTTSASERSWNVQVFRSIDHVSACPLPKNLSIERSIHEAYVEAIRRADRFIYIENQYFIGGCHMWEENKHCGCGNLIPIEIALKVASKIKAGERFNAYIVIPMWPEGVPESETVQDILHWTRETMKMMYRIIAEAIQKSGEDSHPRDYLNFFCLANRETETKGEFVPPYNPHPATHYWSAQKHRRFMVYVHSKLMIVDDAYLLIGSANVNQRSMDGQRDTEMAIGCYQHQPKNGGIRAFRLSLWYEHTGRDEEVYKEPQSLECVKTMVSIGDKMWKIYSQAEVQDMKGVHLVTYPVNVTVKGCVGDLAEIDGYFPDTKTLVRGRRSSVLSSVFTT